MIAIASIICGTIAFCFVVAAVMLERHKRYWQDRGVDLVTADLGRQMDKLSADFATHADTVVTQSNALRLSKAEVDGILNDAGKFSLDVSERLEALRMDLIRVETMIGMGGKR